MKLSFQAPLQPIPDLTFDPELHRYTYKGKPLPWSATKICSWDMDPKVLTRIMETKHIWEPRGNQIHLCLEQFLSGEAQPDPGKYKAWVDPLLAHPFWSQFPVVLGSEYRVVDKQFEFFAGSIDCIVQGLSLRGERSTVLADLKTKQTAQKTSPEKHCRQLGAYIYMLSTCQPKLVIDDCAILTAMPGRTVVDHLNPTECLDEFMDCLEAFKAWKPDW